MDDTLLSPLLLLLLLGLAAAAGLTTRLWPLRWLLLGGPALAVLAWAPLLVVGTLDPDSNPVGLGLLAWLVSPIGLLAALLGLLGWAAELAVDLARRTIGGAGARLDDDAERP